MNIKKGNNLVRFNFKVTIMSTLTLLMILITIFLGNNLSVNDDDYGVTYTDNTVEDVVYSYSYSHIEHEGFNIKGFNPAGYDKSGYDRGGY